MSRVMRGGGGEEKQRKVRLRIVGEEDREGRGEEGGEGPVGRVEEGEAEVGEGGGAGGVIGGVRGLAGGRGEEGGEVLLQLVVRVGGARVLHCRAPRRQSRRAPPRSARRRNSCGLWRRRLLLWSAR